MTPPVTSPIHKAPLKSPQQSQMSHFAKTVYEQKYAFKDENGNVIETWDDTAKRVASHVLLALGYNEDSIAFKKIYKLISERKFMPGGRYLYSAGRPFHAVNNCFLDSCEDSREGWADLFKRAAMVLQTGGGIGVEYSQVRPKGSLISKTGGVASGPLSPMKIVNEIGREVMSGGSRRSAIISLLDWDHPDCLEFIHAKDWSDDVKAMKEKDYSFPATLDHTNISVNLDDEFFLAYEDEGHPKHKLAHKIYHEATINMIQTGEPGFSINVGINSGSRMRNPCGEIDGEITPPGEPQNFEVCCLGSLVLPRFDSVEEFEDAVKWATLFLTAGTVYSDIPHDGVRITREKTRRLGLGIMGVHEWLLQRGHRYEPNEELGEWLEAFSQSTKYAHEWQDKHDLSRSLKTRACAPTGTISILAETTSGLEPIFCLAYKRRYLSGTTWKYQYVVDPTAKRLIEQYDIDPDDIEDAYSLSYNIERRIAMQAWLQQYFDMCLSSTLNLPYPITDVNEIKDFEDMLIQYLPHLRGVTAFPDGSRAGQPLNAVSYHEAVGKEGLVFETEEDANCRSGVCGV